MFVLKPESIDELMPMLKLLEVYDVMVKEIKPGLYGVLSVEHYEEDYTLAEMAAMGNFVQKAHRVCDVCIKKGEKSCGHLTFTEAN